MNLGGDSSRLYFYDPVNFFKNGPLFSVTSYNGLGGSIPNFFMIPFVSLLILLKGILFNSSFLLQNFFSGFLLAGGFYSVYLIVVELLKNGESEIGNTDNFRLAGMLSGLFFVFPQILTPEWGVPLLSSSQILVYPLVFYFLLKYIKTRNFTFLLKSLVLTLIFSPNFSYVGFPWLFPFFIFSFLFLFLYAYFSKSLMFFLKGLVVFSVLFLLVQSFQLLPQFYNLLDTNSSIFNKFFSQSETVDHGLGYFLSIRGHVKLIYNLTNQLQYDISVAFGHPDNELKYEYGIRYLPLFFIFPIILFSGAVLRKKTLFKSQTKTMISVLLVYLILVFFITANITNLGINFYIALFKIPGFSMFRSYYTKFAVTYAFFYSLSLGFSLTAIFIWIKSIYAKRLLIIILTLLILFNGWPLISGRIVNANLWKSKDVKIPVEIDQNYENFLSRIRSINSATKILSFPLTNEAYQLLRGKNDGVYFGPSTIAILANKNDFNGSGSFSEFWPPIQKLIKEDRFSNLETILDLLNIGYVFHNRDDYIYDNFPDYPYSAWFKGTFSNQKSIENFISKLDVKEELSLENYFLYRRNRLLPLFYIPQEIVYSNEETANFADILELGDYQQRPGFYLKNSLNQLLNEDSERIKKQANVVLIKGEDLTIKDIVSDIKIQTNGIFYPYARQKPGSLIWKLVLINEDLNQWKVRNDKEKLFEALLFYANKRIYEALSFNQTEPEGLRIYQEEIGKTIELLKKNKEGADVDLALKIKNNLEDNLNKIKTSSQVNKRGWEETINELERKTNQLISEYDPRLRRFLVNLPVNGKYTVFLRGIDQQCPVKVDGTTVEQNNKVDFAGKSYQWIEAGGVSLQSGQHLLTVDFNNLPNLMSSESWLSIPTSTKMKRFSKLLSSWQPNFSYEISGIKGNKIAKLRFEEDTGGGKYEEIVREHFFSEQDKDFKFYIKSDPKVLQARVIVLFVENVGDAEIKEILNNLKMVQIVEPEVILKSKKLKNDYPKTQLPKITFSQISPTKYYVKVKGAKTPYNLVFSESFNNGWKIFLNNFKFDDGNSRITASYFNEEIEEGVHKNVFLNKDTFKTWFKKPIAEKNHFLINGYANSWLITPEDVGGSEDYELIVEFIPQRLFYIGMVISMISLLGCLLYLIKTIHIKYR